MKDSIRTVWYFPGWMRGKSDHSDNIMSLKRAFPNAGIQVRPWESNLLNFLSARSNADRAAKELAAELENMSQGFLAQLALVGHSLGGRLVLKALSQFAQSCPNKRIGAASIAAAATPTDLPEIRRAAGVLNSELMIISNKFDPLLDIGYRLFVPIGIPILGTAGIKEPQRNICQCHVPATYPLKIYAKAPLMGFAPMRLICAHLAKFYLEFLADIKTNNS